MTYRGICIQVSAHILNLKLQLLLRPIGCPLYHASIDSSHSKMVVWLLSTLKARCSKKCAVPFVSSVSALEPASIHMPTVDVCAHGE